ncbi:MAG: hypothetical protein RL264_1993 [Bacteroidota bacterium]|jgi:hypothetical protein
MRFSIGILFFVLIGLSSCIKHEIIPKPTNTIDLNASFVGYVNGTQMEFTQNVLGYRGYAGRSSFIYASPVLSKMLYTSEMRSAQDSRAIRILFGDLLWDASANTEPTLTMFNDFLSTNSGVPIPFKDYATLVNTNTIGIQVEYTDQNNNVWVSRESDPGQVASFVVLKQASDNTGDYSLFECTFSCKVWRVDPQTNEQLSATVNNAKLRAWFKR